jgi:hypothetical protein
MPDRDSESKLPVTYKCPGCGAEGHGLLWHSHGRTFEDLACVSCNAQWGRIDGGCWHNLTALIGHGERFSRMV